MLPPVGIFVLVHRHMPSTTIGWRRMLTSLAQSRSNEGLFGKARGDIILCTTPSTVW